MSDVQEMKAAELTGLPLHWAVALADRGPDKMPSPSQFKIWDDYRPSINWVVGGPLFDKYAHDMAYHDGWLVAVEGGDALGPTKLIALCRAIVIAKLGDVVRVPTLLIGLD